MKDFLKLLWSYKLWWMTPMGLMLVLFLVLLWLTNATGDSPFIYHLF